MATQSNKLGRIRENQRRSRTRRREHMQEMQQRLRQYELHGVEASTALQAAARKVACENQCLRDMLSERGVTSQQIDAVLARKTQESVDGLGWADDLPLTMTTPTLASVIAPLAFSSAPPPPPSPSLPHQGGGSRCEVRRAHPESTRVSPPEAIVASGDSNTTSCVQAAMIIASMNIKPGMTGEEIREELGCPPDAMDPARDCQVENLTVFRVLDQP
ncbi:MAG: hypothetical protein M1838_002399 [Thelocarpon superellum]|nr:MAG: hypothetical protein M1838_002399 [Thelocarpon superellum]